MAHERVLSRGRRKPLYLPEAQHAVELGRPHIERMLPHRDPLLLVDRIDAVDLAEQSMRAYRRIDPADPILKGHFPGHPVYPGALLVEAMGQASLCLYHLLCAGRVTVPEDDKPLPVRLLRIHHALFQAEVGPGDEMTLLCKQLEDDSFTVTCVAQALVDGKVAALAMMDVYIAEDDED